MSGEVEAIEHTRAQILVLSILLSIDTLIYVGLDQCAFVISSYVADYLDGHYRRVVAAGSIAHGAVVVIITTKTIGNASFPRRTSSNLLALDNSTKSSHAHVSKDAIFIFSATDQRSRLSIKVSDGVVA